MQTAEYCLMNLFPAVLGRVLWEGSTSMCCPHVGVGMHSSDERCHNPSPDLSSALITSQE